MTFTPVAEAFESFAVVDPTWSAQLAVYHRGELVLDLAAGPGLQPDSLLPIFSSSKGATGIVIALLVERGQLDLDATVATYWPEFAAAGKAAITVRTLLSHQAGLTGVTGGFTFEELMEHDGLAKRLGGQRPLWQPGKAHGYHALTIGTLADELVRRIDGRTLAQVLAQDVCGPRAIDVHLGTPASEDHRVVAVQMPTDEEMMAFFASGSLPISAEDALGGTSIPPGGALGLLLKVNEVEFRRAGAPAAGGLASARGLARLYASLRHEVGGPRLLSDDTVSQVSQVQVTGLEITSGIHARFGIVFQAPNPPRLEFGSYQAYGHDGAGGSIGFDDPLHDVSFGYTVQRIPLPGGIDQRAVQLTQVLRACVSAG